MPTQIHHTTCPLDCPSACALEVTLQQGQLKGIKGDAQHPFTQGVICGKVARYGAVQNGPRITQPMKRVGPKGLGHFEPISWDEAMQTVVAQLQSRISRYGAETVWPYWYGGSMGLLQRKALERLTHRAGFSRMKGTICSFVGVSGWQAGVGTFYGPSAEDMAASSDLVILWGINAVSTHINLMNFVKKARARGARLVVVDPYRNRTAKLADEHLNPRPGTDGALAAAMMHVLLAEGLANRDYLARMSDFDGEVEAHLSHKTPEWAAHITGLSAETIRAFARQYGQAAAPYIRMGLGMSRQNNGAVNIHAVSCLPAMVGAWEKPGGGAMMMSHGAFGVNIQAITAPHLVDGTPSRELDMSRLGAVLGDAQLAPPVTAMLIMSVNPAVTAPDLGAVYRGLTRDDLFTVVHEQVMSDTAKFADILLPATTFLEHEDLYSSYGQYTLQHAEALLPPPGACRCNHDWVNDLAQRLGFTEEVFQRNLSETVAQVLADSKLPPREQWSQRWHNVTPHEADRYHRNGFGHADGKFHFRPAWGNTAMPALPDHWAVNRRDLPSDRAYPLDFMTPPAHAVLNSTFTLSADHEQKLGEPTLMINPVDAAERGIVEGDWVVAYNALAFLRFKAHVSEDVRPGLTLCESNFAAHAFKEGISLNALSHANAVLPHGGVAFHDNRVQVEKVD
ncbi:molybdopterin oxidoreductase [Magnetococcus marinus MC-1]|uniref:Molybdopterin oxidoreductase n=1 Tax=Magnetococcus marinus (strain ATCC BAA-1437 / JCM 17883 / MC-1) TaxID=156889 RepID=A0L846_MAGMM|nr:molybdopterin oxidoreductase family protein [Magnetococcus marinus]ABK44139.1 molybdopterin oxidoreductase [Magnetococcus marinus MC-1]